jgi:hypothetical protein
MDVSRQESARWSAAWSVGAPCAGSTTSTGSASSGRGPSTALDPEHKVVVLPPEEGLDADRKPVGRRVQVGLAAVPGPQPGDVGAAAAGLLGSDAELPHEVVYGQRAEEEQPGAVVNCVRRHLLWPPLARRPVRVRRLPVPKSSL